MHSAAPIHSYRAAVITVSDSSNNGQREDTSGPAVADLLRDSGFLIAATKILPDEKTAISDLMIKLCQEADLIVTTGGTGLGPRDVTPEATLHVCDRLIPGLAEMMRTEGLKRTAFAPLSRSVCGARGKTLMLNLPGNPKGAVDSLQSILHLLPHALDLLQGKTEHTAKA